MAANSNSRIEARLNSKLKELEAVSRQRDDALKANTTLQTEMSQFRKKDEAELAKLTAEVRTLQGHKENLEAQMMELYQKSDRNDEVCENMRAVERQKEELEWRLKELQQQNKELHNEVEEVKQVATGLRDEVRRLREKDEQLQARLEESCRCVEDQRKSVALVTKEREELDRAINVLKAQQEDVRLKDQAKIDKLTGDLVEMRAKMAKMENDSEAIVKNYQEKCTILQNERDAVRSEKETLQVQCTTHLTLIPKLETSYRDAQTQIKALDEEKTRLANRKVHYYQEFQKVSKELDNQRDIVAQQLKSYESDFAKERAQRERQVLDLDSLNKKLSESNAEKKSLQQDINSLTARLQKYEEDGGSHPSSIDKSQEAMRRMRAMASELEMASRRVRELHSQNLQLEAELKKCYKRIEDQKNTIEEEKVKTMVKKVLCEERDKELEASDNFQRRRLGSLAPEGEGAFNNLCPICGRRAFKSAEDLLLHGAKCTDFKDFKP